MTRGYWPLILVLAAAWGASFLFIKLAIDDIKPAPMMAARSLLAAALLLPAVLLRAGRTAIAELRSSWRDAAVLGAINAAIPFWLIGWGEKYIDSSVAGVALATVPLFVFLLGLRFLPHERVTALRWAGVALGLAGVVALIGFDPGGGRWAIAGALAAVLASVCYASGGIYGQLRVRSVTGPVLAAGSMLAAGIYLLPLALFQLPGTTLGWRSILGLLGLTVIGTAFAQLLFFRALRLYGARRVSFLAYLMPCFAVVYGALALDEAVTAAILGGLVLILLGVALGSGALGTRRGAADPPDPAATAPAP